MDGILKNLSDFMKSDRNGAFLRMAMRARHKESGASRPYRSIYLGGTPKLLEAPDDSHDSLGKRGAASPLIWVVSAKQLYHFFDWR
jgi:hypothetical protein